jgi:hypothetical protein
MLARQLLFLLLVNGRRSLFGSCFAAIRNRPLRKRRAQKAFALIYP